MNESKIGLTQRLRQEGRWEEASQYRDEVRKELRSQGKPRAEAAEAAWDAMMEKYPPLPPAEPTAQGPTPEPENLDFDGLMERTGGSEPDLPRDVLWVYDHLENRKARPEDAPTLGAWSLLKWARDYRNRFFEQLLPKALAVKERQKEDEQQAGKDLTLDEVARLLREVDKDDPYLEAKRLREENATLKAELQTLSKKE